MHHLRIRLSRAAKEQPFRFLTFRSVGFNAPLCGRCPISRFRRCAVFLRFTVHFGREPVELLPERVRALDVRPPEGVGTGPLDDFGHEMRFAHPLVVA